MTCRAPSGEQSVKGDCTLRAPDALPGEAEYGTQARSWGWWASTATTRASAPVPTTCARSTSPFAMPRGGAAATTAPPPPPRAAGAPAGPPPPRPARRPGGAPAPPPRPADEPGGEGGVDPLVEVRHEVGQDGAVAAQRGGDAALEEPRQVVAGPGGVLGVALLRETGLEPEPAPGGARVGGQGVAGPRRRAAHEAGDAVGGEQGDEPGRLVPALVVQRSKGVLLGPRRARTGLGVPDDGQRPGGERALLVGDDEGLELGAVVGIAQPGGRDVRLEPGDLVDLVDEPAVAAGHLGGPVADLLDRGLAALGHRVGRRRERVTEADPQAGLLEGLADGRVGEGLAGVELALRPGPVVVARPVDEGDLEPTASTSPRQGARGQHAHHAQRRALRRRLACMAMSASWMSGRGCPSAVWWTRVHRPSPASDQWA